MRRIDAGFDEKRPILHADPYEKNYAVRITQYVARK